MTERRSPVTRDVVDSTFGYPSEKSVDHKNQEPSGHYRQECGDCWRWHGQEGGPPVGPQTSSDNLAERPPPLKFKKNSLTKFTQSQMSPPLQMSPPPVCHRQISKKVHTYIDFSLDVSPPICYNTPVKMKPYF